MRVFVSSTSSDLAAHRAAAADVIQDLGWVPAMMEHFGTDGGSGIVDACRRRVDEADVVLALIAWRRGSVPPIDLGGDGRSSYSQFELDRAFQRGKPVLVLMADDSWPGKLWEDDQDARAWVRNFRGNLDRLAVFFRHDDLEGFKTLVRQELLRHQEGTLAESHDSNDPPVLLQLRGWTMPPLPDRPYPLLLPYRRPDLFAGRSRELAEVRRLLALPLPILGLHAPSGTGKTSLLAAGLTPMLRSDGVPVALDRRPSELGLADRLLSDLLTPNDGDDWPTLAPDAPQSFVEQLLRARDLANAAPVLIIDQFEDVIRSGDHEAVATLGTLLAASVCRQRGVELPCRWVLAYRQEFHGRATRWLRDVLAAARTAGWSCADRLPHDLTDRFHSWPLPPLGTAAPGADADRLKEATRSFRNVIERPLEILDASGGRRYPWRIDADDASRLAGAFASARAEQPHAPLVPEMQVVLSHLLESAQTVAKGRRQVRVPPEADALVEQALENHLRRALDEAFRGEPANAAREGRSRVLLSLRELVDEEGTRVEGLPANLLATAVGENGEEVLERLAGPNTRVILPREHADGLHYALSHDQLAEVVVRLVAEEGRGRGSGFDDRLLELHRFVALDTELYKGGEESQATVISGWRYRRIARHAKALIWDRDQRAWWQACIQRRRRFRRRLAIGSAIVVLTLLVAGHLGWQWIQRSEAVAVVQAGDLSWIPHDGTSDVRNEAVLQKVEIVLQALAEAPDENLTAVGALAWALDYFPGRDPAFAARAHDLRERLLAPLRADHPPPAALQARSLWITLPGGWFQMGSNDTLFEDEEPEHSVRLTPFRMLRHEVTNEEYRWLVPHHDPEADSRLPAVNVTWFDAYAYAAWIGGRLPTEAEWEYAAGVGCEVKYCGQDGDELDLDQVAWYRKNADKRLHPVEGKAANQWGLYDMYGNAWEWVADWYARPYPSEDQVDPRGPATGDGRAIRSLGFDLKEIRAHPSYRNVGDPGHNRLDRGFRVVLAEATAEGVEGTP